MSAKKFFSFLGWPILLAPIAMLWLGIACNNLASNLNGYRMPVENPICATDPGKVGQDYIHVCADSHTRVKFLVDRFPTNDGILSFGDALQSESAVLARPSFFLWLLYGALSILGVARKK
jgi:hypothetical protein